MYVAISAAFLGKKLSPDTYDDSVPTRVVQCPFRALPSTWARERLLQYFIMRFQAANPDNDDDKLTGDLSKVFRENNISLDVASPAVLPVMSALHISLLNLLFWLFPSTKSFKESLGTFLRLSQTRAHGSCKAHDAPKWDALCGMRLPAERWRTHDLGTKGPIHVDLLSRYSTE
ncbi:hypothetical protein EDC04DRAFT_2729117 [Pisolithus marmoratus]|nr:hypothetical protein EDC04DRAFT_2729117 [Pisolithus marmoratus]